MISKERAIQLMQESMSSLRRVGLIQQDVIVHSDTILLGVGTPLDSIAFVTFVTDLEDRLTQESGQEIYLVLNDIHEFNPNDVYLSADILARYIVRMVEKEDDADG